MQRITSKIRDERGFTLIEIIMVIVLLGIIAAIAIPKYIDLKTDAVKASLDGLKGGMVSAAAIGYADIAIKGYYNPVNYPTETDLNGSYLQSDDLNWGGATEWTAVVGGDVYTFTYYQASGGVDRTGPT
jgi:prepilin-type N-terminal cleavage/methylation domain-containing protein